MRRLLLSLLAFFMILGCAVQENATDVKSHLFMASAFHFKKKTVKPNSGYTMLIIGLRKCGLSCAKRRYRLIDTVEYYGGEKGVHKAIKAGVVKRSDAYDHPLGAIKKIAKKYHKTSAPIILRRQLQSGYIAIPGSSNSKHMKENDDLFDFKLSQKDMSDIKKSNTYKRYENW